MRDIAGDVVSLHLPLTTETHHLLDRDALGWMKPGAVLVNTSRGAIVDEATLIDGLRHGRPTVDTMRRYLVEAVTNCRRLRDGQRPARVVNQPTGY